MPGTREAGCLWVVPGRLELPTSTLSVWRSNQLSYRTVTTPRNHRKGARRVKSAPVKGQPIPRQEAGRRKGATRGAGYISSIWVITENRDKKQGFAKEPEQYGLRRQRHEGVHQQTGKAGSRKEVFQPHLPVRLPCYDLAPITSFTLGRPSRSRTSGAPGFHGLTGGVYKARERIHRAMADARLLANPASWGRVADPNPNYDAF